MVYHYYELASRYNELVFRYYELASRYNEVVASYYDLVSRYYELVSRYFEDFFFSFFFKCPYRLSYLDDPPPKLLKWFRSAEQNCLQS